MHMLSTPLGTITRGYVILFGEHDMKRGIFWGITLLALILSFTAGFFIGKTIEQASIPEIGAESIPATTYYEVESNGTLYWATRYDGQIAYGGTANAGGTSGTDAVAVINSALNNLTSERTRQLKVSLRGKFDCGDSLSIKIPSYTILDLSEAEIIDARTPQDSDKGSEQIIENTNPSGNTQITIISGNINGQRGNYSSQTTGEGDAIRLVNCTHSTVLQTHIKNAARSGLMTISCQYCLFIDVTAKNCGGFGQIEQTGDNDCLWLRCISKDSNISGSGFNWCSYAKRLSFTSCEAINNSAGEGFSSSNTIEGRINFYECKAEFNGKNGFCLHYGETLHNCIARNNSQSSPLSYDGMTTDGSIGWSEEGVVIMGGAAYDDQTNKTQRFGLNLNNAKSMAIGVDCKGNGHPNYDITWFIGIEAQNIVSMCKGRIQYQGYFTPQPSIPLSGMPRTNTYGLQCMIYISGGNVTEVAINGQKTGLTDGSFLLDPSDNITIIYTSDPTWRWFAYGNMDL